MPRGTPEADGTLLTFKLLNVVAVRFCVVDTALLAVVELAVVGFFLPPPPPPPPPDLVTGGGATTTGAAVTICVADELLV